MPTLEAPPAGQVADKPPDPVDEEARAGDLTDPVDRLPTRSARRSRSGDTELLQRCLDLVVTGNLAASRRIHTLAEITERLVRAPFDLGRGVINSAVVVDVDVDVDFASRQIALEECDQKEGR